MIPQKYLDLLDELGAGSHTHSMRTLKDHLIGTYNLLVEWGNPEYVALGGLFHSIYGTQVYRISSTSLESRPRIVEVIGEDAEKLAYLFCITDRQGFFYEAEKQDPVLWDFVHDRLIPATPQTIRELIEIEVANDIEQRDLSVTMKPHFLSRRKHMLARCRPFMSPSAQVAIAKTIEVIRVEKRRKHLNSKGAARKTISIKLVQA